MHVAIEFIRHFFNNIAQLSPVMVFLFGTIALLGLISGRLEGWTKPNALYYAFITGLTIGYGDFRPTRPITRLLSVIIGFTGILLTGILVAAALEAVRQAFGNTLM